MARVLIIDDEKSVATALQEGLKRYSKEFKTDVAFNAEEAFKLIEKRSYQIVVSDIRLPGRSGLDVLLKLKDEQPEAGFIAMTAFSSPAVEQQVWNLGGLKYLEKPFEFEELESLILEFIRDNGKKENEGLLQSLELSSVVQLINMEGKTLVLEVSSGNNTGYLSFSRGELFDASFQNLQGEKAAVAMFSLPQCRLVVTSTKRGRKKTIKRPLMNLLMKAMKDSDEKLRKEQKQLEFEESTGPIDVENLEAMIKLPLKELTDVKGFVSIGLYDESGMLLVGKGMEGKTVLMKVQRDFARLIERSTAVFSLGKVGTIYGVVVNFSRGALIGKRFFWGGIPLHMMVHIDENGNLAMARKTIDLILKVLTHADSGKVL
ncbi:MAG: response regulator [Acidobacteria bacterium]|nr:response regulator [Acidobacteriota bacterium]